VQRGHALISAAARLIQQSGADELTMQNVATEAGLSLRVLYQHFEGKDDLLVALIEETQVVFARLLEDNVVGRSDPLERLGAALYFATDPRQHSDRQYNTALAKFLARTAISAPEELGRAHRPVVEFLTRLIDDAMRAGQIEAGDPEQAAFNIHLAYFNYDQNVLLGNSVGAMQPSNELFLRFCIQGLGAQLPLGWEEQFRLSDDEARRSALQTVRLLGVKASSKRVRTSKG
jgi:AcrR family transcriptional regulator